MKSLNQLYKESGSELPFKQWVERAKMDGIVPDNPPMEAIGLEKASNPMTRNLLFVGVLFFAVGFGVYRYIKKNK